MKHLIQVFVLSSILFFLLSVTSCKQNNVGNDEEKVDQVVVRMEVEPETLNPMLATSNIAREIYQYVFSTLADYDYETLELKPVLIKSIPEAQELEDGINGSKVKYEIELKEDAQWNNNQAITAQDVLFTLKLAAHPNVKNPAWKYLLTFITHVEIDTENPLKIIIYSSQTSFQIKEYLLSIEIYPRHVFDPADVLGNYTFAQMMDFMSKKQETEDPAFLGLAKEFSSLNFNTSLEGAGPYLIEKRETDQFIVLRQKENYWGDRHPDLDQLESLPDRIVFQIIKDPSTATTLLKNQEIDIMDMSKAAFANFDDLKNDANFSDDFEFFTPEIPRYLIFNINNDDPRLSDKNVRLALDHLTDKERIINQLEGSYAKVVNSTILSSKEEYNRDLGFRNFDIKMAIELLEDAGWTDSNGNGTRDKQVNGKLEELSLRFHFTGSDKSTAIVNILKESAEQAGIEIVPVIKPYKSTVSENFIPGDYELSLTRHTSAPVKYDPYLQYHSSSIQEGGRNYNKFSNARVDELINIIRSTKDPKEQIGAYREFQQILFDECPIIYLYADQLRIVASKGKIPVISEKNPCYFVNALPE